VTRWVAIFEDDPARIGVRSTHDQAHFAYLDRHRDRILIAGGLRPAPGEPHSGGLWVMEVETREEAVRLCENDPYFLQGLRRAYRLCVWGKAFEDRWVSL